MPLPLSSLPHPFTYTRYKQELLHAESFCCKYPAPRSFNINSFYCHWFLAGYIHELKTDRVRALILSLLYSFIKSHF